MSEEIPQPPGLPILGNVLSLDPEHTSQSFQLLAAQHGPIYKLNLLGREIIVVSSHELFEELCDDRRFRKAVSKPLIEARNGVGGGLFTAYHGEHEWEVAHRTLVPAFGPLPIQDMYDEMHDIASQMILKWSRLGPDAPIAVTEDFTRLTLDSIALCAMDTRFNSFYHDEMHPFVQAMVDFLAENGARPNRTAIAQFFMRETNRKYWADIDIMKRVAQGVVEQRRRVPSDKKDLLNAMINGRDPRTGEAMTDESIMNNMITFLIAGHETTSGMLSFTTYFLLKNPATYRKAQEEVDRVVGSGPVEYKHIAQLHYVQACLRESIRLEPTAPAFSREVAGDNPEIIGGGKYLIPKGVPVACLLPAIHRDPKIYGEDAGAFKPERMLDEKFQNLPSSSWKPFGTGPRACIGRPFAWQEAVLSLAMILQNFDLRLVNPSYQLSIKQTLTVKPQGLEIYASRRGDQRPGQLEKKLFGGAAVPEQSRGREPVVDGASTSQGSPIAILYGSNTGTCEGLAQALANRSAAHGFKPLVATLDSAVGKLPTDRPVVILTASFEGEPADNAGQFVEWVQHVEANALKGVNYAVFGCGHRDWVSTFQRVPKRLDAVLEEKGATRIIERGLSDVSMGMVFDDFDTWTDGKLWPALGSNNAGKAGEELSALDVVLSSSARVDALKHNVYEAVVEKQALLSGPGVSEKRMITFQLPTGASYTAGDYLNVLPLNPHRTVTRVLKRFGLAWDSEITIKPSAHTTLPVNKPQPVTTLLSSYVELGSPASRKNILALVHLTKDEVTKASLEDLAENSAGNKLSVLDILDMYPELECPFGLFLSLLPSMRLRQYSISSSPLSDPSLVSITYAVIDAPMLQPNKPGPTLPNGLTTPPSGNRFLGVTTNHLKTLEPGERCQIAIKKSHQSFHLPADNERPVIMVCAGTGIAPFRAFVEERAAKLAAGQTSLGPALLFVGCKDSGSDRLYAGELEAWEKAGAVEVFYAFSKQPGESEGCKYAQERVYNEKKRVVELFDAGAKVFVCGAHRLGAGVKDVSKKLYMERKKETGADVTDADAEQWFEALKVQERYSSDVFD